jgi:hypothetical protein
MLHLVLAALRFAVFANFANHSGQFGHIRRIGCRHLPQRSARSDRVLHRFCAGGQLLVTLSEEDQTMRDTRFTRVDAPGGISDEIAVLTRHSRVVVMFMFGCRRRSVGSQCGARSGDPSPSRSNHFEKLASIHGDLPGEIGAAIMSHGMSRQQRFSGDTPVMLEVDYPLLPLPYPP